MVGRRICVYNNIPLAATGIIFENSLLDWVFAFCLLFATIGAILALRRIFPVFFKKKKKKDKED